jgi:hypothetical protein
LLLCAGVLSTTPGCAPDSAPVPDTNGPDEIDTPAPVALPNGGHIVSEYVLQVRPRSKTTKLLRLKPGVSSRPGFNPASVDSLNAIQDNNPGFGPTDSVELDTDQNSIFYGAACPGGLTASFCGTVTLGSFYTRPLNNVYVQVTSITDVNGATLANHSSINSDAAPSWLSDGGLGLWSYKATSSTNAGVIGTAPDNFGARTWVFADPDQADTNILLRVVSTLTYTDYTRTTSMATWVDACALAVHTSYSASGDTASTIPFTFTFYDKVASGSNNINYNRDGVFTFLSTRPPSATNSTYPTTPIAVGLPENPQVKSASPAGYVFWDGLNYGTTSTLCAGLDPTSTAPQRRYVVTWKNMKFFGSSVGVLNFGAIFNEGTDTIDMIYNSMTGTPAARVAGSGAIAGAVQGKFGSTNISTPSSIAIGATVVPTSGLKFRFTPKP